MGNIYMALFLLISLLEDLTIPTGDFGCHGRIKCFVGINAHLSVRPQAV